jgi:predicted molibdopterin-dependent oxidoreductase YjgC
VAIIVPSKLTDADFSRIKELAGLLKNVTYYPIVRRSNFQGALDMGVLPDYYPGYRKVSADTTASLAGSWNAILPGTAGKNAVQMVDAIAAGKLHALYIMGDDPIGSDPGLKPVLAKLDFLVVQDIFMTETAQMADVVLPAASYVEKSGTFTNLERRLQQVNRAEEPYGESRPDWEILVEVAKKMGGALNYGSPRDITAEIRSSVPLYAGLAVGSCWPREKSPLAGTDVDLSLASKNIMQKEVITAEKQMFSSGMTITRSHEIGTIKHIKIEV